MFEIGTKVSYIRQITQRFLDRDQTIPNPNFGKVVKGKGIVMAYCLDTNKRRMIQIKDGDAVFNVDHAAIDCSPEFIKEYENHIENVKGLTKEGNDKSKAIVTEYNARIESERDKVLGKALEI